MAPIAAQEKRKEVHGVLQANETWSGKILLSGDVQVPKDMRLTILAGTDVRVAPDDKTKQGWRVDKAEIHVEGQILIQGTEEKPVVFKPVGAPSEDDDVWHGIVLRPEKGATKRSMINSVRMHNAFGAIQVPIGGPRITDSVFFNCFIGVEVGSAYTSRNAHSEIKTGSASPLVSRSRFANCKTGVFLEHLGSPDVRNCVFYQCQTALGNNRQGLTSDLRDPGAIVERCAFISNSRGVVGQALVRDSIFLGNSTGMRLSNFHYRYSTKIDHVALRSNLFHDNSADIEGDTGLDNDPVHGDPQFAGPLAKLADPGVTLPPCLKLGSSSPARLRATDGGDIGPMGSPKAMRDEARWGPLGTVVGEMFALPTEMGGAKSSSMLSSRPSAGKRVSKSWWVRPMPGSRGEFDLVHTFGKKASGGWMSFVARSSKAGKAKIEINGDVHRVGIFVNGKPSTASVVRRRRFGIGGAVIEVDVKSGVNTFIMRVEGWGMRPRFGVALPSSLTAGKAPKPATASIKISSARLVKRKRDRFIDMTMSASLSWSDNDRIGVFTIKDGKGELVQDQERLDLKVLSLRKLRLSNVPADWKKPLQIEFNGLRGPKGQVYGKTPACMLK